jgi:hypothetical protein
MNMLMLRQSLLLFSTVPFFSFASPLNLNNSDSISYATEALTENDYGPKGVIISSASDTLNLIFEAGFGISNDPRFIRIDVINGYFNNNFPNTGIVANGSYGSVLSQGGAIGDTWLIAEVSSSGALGPSTLFTLGSNSFILRDINTPLSIKYRLYDSPADAVNQGPSLYDIKKEIVTVVSAVGDKFVHSFEHAVGFGQDFLRFNATFRPPNVFSLGDASNALASIGKVQFDNLIIGDVRKFSDSTSITDFRDLVPDKDTSVKDVVITGDFSTVKAFLNQNDDCSGGSYILAEYSSLDEISLSMDTMINYPVLCISASSETIAIRRSTYQVDIGIGIQNNLFGEIIYDASSIDVPYVTGYEGYRQRIYLVNHAGYDVRYRTEFVAESGVENNFVVGIKSTGVIPAQQSVKLNSDELVRFNDGVTTRISARIYLDAKPADISAAVQLLSIGKEFPPITSELKVQQY